MEVAPDFDEFIGCLTAHGVDFVIVGAYALAFHGAPRFTGDLDVLIRPTLDNAERLLKALDAFGFPSSGLTAEAVADRQRRGRAGTTGRWVHTRSRSSDARHTCETSGRRVARRTWRISTRSSLVVSDPALKPSSRSSPSAAAERGDDGNGTRRRADPTEPTRALPQ
jgi:hypothetical protein